MCGSLVSDSKWDIRASTRRAVLAACDAPVDVAFLKPGSVMETTIAVKTRGTRRILTAQTNLANASASASISSNATMANASMYVSNYLYDTFFTHFFSAGFPL